MKCFSLSSPDTHIDPLSNLSPLKSSRKRLPRLQGRCHRLCLGRTENVAEMEAADQEMTWAAPRRDSPSSTAAIDGMENLGLDAPVRHREDLDAASSTKHHVPAPTFKNPNGASRQIQESPSIRPQTESTDSPLSEIQVSSPQLESEVIAKKSASSISSSPLNLNPATPQRGYEAIEISNDNDDNDDNDDDDDDDDNGMASTTPLRRSTRCTAGKHTTTRLADEVAEHQTLATPRRNAKRKATTISQKTAEMTTIPENILEESLRPLTQQELEEWDGWLEIESEPVCGLSCLLFWHSGFQLTPTRPCSTPFWVTWASRTSK
jgi:hypothetical protein